MVLVLPNLQRRSKTSLFLMLLHPLLDYLFVFFAFPTKKNESPKNTQQKESDKKRNCLEEEKGMETKVSQEEDWDWRWWWRIGCLKKKYRDKAKPRETKEKRMKAWKKKNQRIRCNRVCISTSLREWKESPTKRYETESCSATSGRGCGITITEGRRTRIQETIVFSTSGILCVWERERDLNA